MTWGGCGKTGQSLLTGPQSSQLHKGQVTYLRAHTLYLNVSTSQTRILIE